jgi:hypothetical protein
MGVPPGRKSCIACAVVHTICSPLATIFGNIHALAFRFSLWFCIGMKCRAHVPTSLGWYGPVGSLRAKILNGHQANASVRLDTDPVPDAGVFCGDRGQSF